MNDTSTIFTILGITGDLSQRKLLPALYTLFKDNTLPKQFRIVGFSRRDWTNEQLHIFITDTLKGKTDPKILSNFLKHVEYAKGTLDDPQAYIHLKEQLQIIDTKIGQSSNKLFFLAVAPNFYEDIFKEFKNAGLNTNDSVKHWTRILVEKPFGNDTSSAEKLEKELAKVFKESQIFRIDHYLAKETVQNILTFRFVNAIFEPIWNAKYIEKVEIKMLEKVDVSDRGDFYDSVGALRDVGQNHVLQMLALIAMERPKTMIADEIRSKRADVLKKLIFIKKGQPLIRGQYQGFTKEEGVQLNSQTETYFKLAAGVSTSRWKGVPFILESGKALIESKTEVAVYFKSTNGSQQNVIRFRIQPNEGIDVQIGIKKPGFENVTEQSNFSFSYSSLQSAKVLPDAYERVFIDCIRGDQTLFTTSAEVISEWKFITPILKDWQKNPLMPYSKNSHGPLIS